MCDYSLHAVETRPAEVGDKLRTDELCQLLHARLCRGRRAERGRVPEPGTELAFERDVEIDHGFGRLLPSLGFGSIGATRSRASARSTPTGSTPITTRLEFPNGRIVLVTRLCEGQVATVLQLPASEHAGARRSVRRLRLSHKTA